LPESYAWLSLPSRPGWRAACGFTDNTSCDGWPTQARFWLEWGYQSATPKHFTLADALKSLKSSIAAFDRQRKSATTISTFDITHGLGKGKNRRRRRIAGAAPRKAAFRLARVGSHWRRTRFRQNGRPALCRRPRVAD
jgi:hypothetical protein